MNIFAQNLPHRATTPGMIVHEINKIIKEVRRVVRARRCLGVILNGKCGELLATDSSEGIVVEIHVRRFDILATERIHVHAEPVVLGGYFDFFRRKMHHWMICSAVPKF